MWNGNKHDEKGIKPIKNEFVSKKRKFIGNIIEKLYSKKIMKHLLNEIDCDSNANHNISNYLIKSNEFLIEKLKCRLPIPFVINANNKCLFLIKN